MTLDTTYIHLESDNLVKFDTVIVNELNLKEGGGRQRSSSVLFSLIYVVVIIINTDWER